MIEATKYGVFLLDDRRYERFNPDIAGRPQLIKGSSQILFGGMGRLTENSIVSIKNKSYAVTADVEVPPSGAEGVIIAQGGSVNGWSLYAKGGKLKYCYNLLGIELTFVEGAQPLPAGHHQVRMEFKYDGGGVGKGGGIALFVDGKDVGRGRVERTVAMIFALADLLFSVRTGKSAFEHTFGTGIFEYFRENPEPARTFGEAMTAWTNQLAGAVVASFDFSPFDTVVDIGGSHGTLLAAILRKNPAIRGILFDLPNVIAGAAAYLAAEGVADRCTRIGGDFFEAVPAGGDLYVLAQILHDWDDERCAAILRRCRAALRDGGKLLIVELVLPPGDEPFFGKWLDLHMLVMASGRERTAAEYQQLLQAAGFELIRVQPTAAGASIVEAVST